MAGLHGTSESGLVAGYHLDQIFARRAAQHGSRGINDDDPQPPKGPRVVGDAYRAGQCSAVRRVPE
ncbi:hypothetical protein C6361_34990 [Plantactinospora sp. BC1]|nr:hypothetical protein C6361_34990 [Plantactinospora sp. BC1]